jgi:hypothetical protein
MKEATQEEFINEGMSDEFQEELTYEDEQIVESLVDLQNEFEEIMTEVGKVIESTPPQDLPRLFARALTIQNELLKRFFSTVSSHLSQEAERADRPQS